MRAQQALVAEAEGLIFVAPVFWMGFPAILKGWFERVFAYGFAYTLTREGWQGRPAGTSAAPLPGEGADHHADLLHRRGVRQGLAGGDGHGYLRMGPEDGRVKEAHHVYFYAVVAADNERRRAYLRGGLPTGEGLLDIGRCER